MSCEIIQFSAAARPARKDLDKLTAAKVPPVSDFGTGRVRWRRFRKG